MASAGSGGCGISAYATTRSPARYLTRSAIAPPSTSRTSTTTTSIVGGVPRWLDALPNLTVLRLSHNSLSGHIPPSLANLTKIVQLEFDQNLMESSIPDGLSSLPALRMLALSHNSLTGEIPPSFFNMTSLRGLTLVNNVFRGELPADRRRRMLPWRASARARETMRGAPTPGRGGSAGAGHPSHRSRTPTDDGGAWEFLNNLTNCNTLAEIFLDGNMFADVMLSSVVVPSTISRLATSRSYSSST
uniref:Leucine Rich Repeat family protein n=2 Tax=Oryza sativa subsp. japonica TaxID=39947 RepID=Q75KW6_ORYSJ|nr:putative receptor kinase-like protein [Oryza sativa Japonica Group]ABF98801.1 Leucine Rich Repeat family protein [Oryza sativa Japonica Group]